MQQWIKKAGCGFLVLLMVSCLRIAAQDDSGMRPINGAVLDAARFNSESSMSGGIQEAMDALPPAGGAVLIPPGTTALRRPIFMKPNSKLVGAGRSTVLKKDAAFLVSITADAKRGQDYIQVADTAPIRAGACIAVGDTNVVPIINSLLIVTNIVGDRLYFHQALSPGNRTLPCDLAVARGACAMNLFMLVVPAKDAFIMDLELDGNHREQMRDHPLATAVFRYSRDKLGAGLYPAQGKVERCWIHDCVYGVHVSVATGIELRNCDVYRNSGDGVHLGGGPHSKIANNRIYDNGASGIYFCYANRKVIITGNEIMRNHDGIHGMDDGNPVRDTTADRSSIISQNIIYENICAGIRNGGKIGPQDFIITDNILHNNQRAHGWRGLPKAGMLLYGPQRCVIANNRSYDDRETYPHYMLTQPVTAGASTICMGLADRNVHSEPYLLTNDWLRVGAATSVYAVASVSNLTVELDRALPDNLPAEAPMIRVAAQDWGIAILRGACDNMIIGNVCAGNLAGGILIEGMSNNVVGHNVGTVVEYNGANTAGRNVSPTPGNR